MDASTYLTKLADLLDSVTPQPHQQKLIDESTSAPSRKLLYHSLGSGKTLSALGMAEAQKQPYTAVVPASLRQNWHQEREKFTDLKTPGQVMSYTQLGMGKPVENNNTLIFDEAHRLRNPGTSQSQQAMRAADNAKQLVMLSGTPVVNDPSDLAPMVSMLTGQHMNPTKFRERFVKDNPVSPGIFNRLRGVPYGKEEDINNERELKAMLQGHVDYYAPPKTTVPVTHEDHHVEMGAEQSQLYNAMWGQLPWALRWKLRNDFPMNSSELQRSVSFLTGPRQIGLSTLPYRKDKDPIKAFEQSPKLMKAHEELTKHLTDPRKKALVFANFIDAGLTPYAAKLQQQGIPHAMFHGKLNDKQRRQLVDDFNANKIRVALIGPSGTEGLSFKGVQLVQILDNYWNQTRGNQAQGRGLRFDSHTGLPDDLQDVKIQRFHSKLPMGLKDRLLTRVGFNRENQTRTADQYLASMSERKQKLNQKFLDLLKEVGTNKA